MKVLIILSLVALSSCYFEICTNLNLTENYQYNYTGYYEENHSEYNDRYMVYPQVNILDNYQIKLINISELQAGMYVESYNGFTKVSSVKNGYLTKNEISLTFINNYNEYPCSSYYEGKSLNLLFNYDHDYFTSKNSTPAYISDYKYYFSDNNDNIIDRSISTAYTIDKISMSIADVPKNICDYLGYNISNGYSGFNKIDMWDNLISGYTIIDYTGSNKATSLNLTFNYFDYSITDCESRIITTNNGIIKLYNRYNDNYFFTN